MPLVAVGNAGGDWADFIIPAPPATKTTTVIDWAHLSFFSASAQSSLRMQVVVSGNNCDLANNTAYQMIGISNDLTGAGIGAGYGFTRFPGGLRVCDIASAVKVIGVHVNGISGSHSYAIGYHYE